MKNSVLYVCRDCQGRFPKWSGKCLGCGGWDTLVEQKVSQVKKLAAEEQLLKEGLEPLDLAQVKAEELTRFVFSFNSINKVFGGGLVAGSVVLLGGDPGVGKSTLALQLLLDISNKYNTLYISGEESAHQVKHHFTRLSVLSGQFPFLNETSLPAVIATLIKIKPEVVVIDSIQTLLDEESSGEAGGLNQVRTACVKLLAVAKRYNIAIVLIGHVTKEGSVAGPKALEHLVDAVLYLEGDRLRQYRVLRAVKNRFGALGEVAVLALNNNGFEEVKNPAGVFLPADLQLPIGSAVAPVIFGSQIFFVMIEVLLNKTTTAYPKHMAVGLETKKLELILAILAKYLKVNVGNYDVYVKVVGDLFLEDSGFELSLATAILSAYYEKVLPPALAIFGEVSLTGEVRPVGKTKERLTASQSFGFKAIWLPPLPAKVNSALKLLECKSVNQLAEYFQK